MRSKRLPLWLFTTGIVLLVPGILWVSTSRHRLNQEDASLALQPFSRIALDRIDQIPVSRKFVIPATAQWTKLRRVTDRLKGQGTPA